MAELHARIVPPAAPRACAVPARVTRRITLCREHVQLEFNVPAFPPSQPGQFLQLQCRDDDPAEPRLLEWHEGRYPPLSAELWDGGRPYLRRPFSIADRSGNPDGSATMAVISRAIGIGTRWLDRVAVGHSLNISGPLGRPFRVPPDARPLVLMGGGVGIPPLLYLARVLHAAGTREVTIVFGATTRALFPVPLQAEPDPSGASIPCLRLPADAPYSAIVTTDDGTMGLRGYVTAALDRLRPGGGAAPLVLACGPEAMLRSVATRTRALGWECQLCVETVMGCGLGTCLSCVVRVRDARRPAGWRWAMACTDGPVFDRDELLDESTAQPA